MNLENCRRRRRNLSAAWIDYRKAFDSVPHSWILKTLEMYKVSPVVLNFLKHSMGMWNTKLYLSHTGGTAISNRLNIRRGIFQGDSLSPLLFCLSLIPLTHELNNSSYGYKINKKIFNHLLYLEDLKLFAKDDNELKGLLNIVKYFSDDIGMDFGLDKCAKVTFLNVSFAY